MANTYVRYPPASGGGGVSTLNGLSGALTLVAGANITITPSGSNITIASTGGGGSAAGPANSVQFSDGAGGFAAGNIVFDNTNTSLGVGTTTPDISQGVNLDVVGNTSPGELGILRVSGGSFTEFQIHNEASDPGHRNWRWIARATGSGDNFQLQTLNDGWSGEATMFQVDRSGQTYLGAAQLQWPNADGSPNQVLSTNGSQILSWQYPGTNAPARLITGDDNLTGSDAIVIANDTSGTGVHTLNLPAGVQGRTFSFGKSAANGGSSWSLNPSGGNSIDGPLFTVGTDIFSIVFIGSTWYAYA